MKVETKRNLQDNIPELKKASYRIEDSAVVHITRILRNMYEDPVKAVVREYIANAYDAHNQIGQKKMIVVDGPTRMAPTFRVRDFGEGLSVEDVEKLLLGYGASGDIKRQSDEQIGGFGIGCKCAFAIADTFTYVSWHKGMKQTWLCQLDDRDMGQAKLISHVPSDEPSGLMVEIPISKAQTGLFDKQLKQVPLFFQQPLQISGTTFKPADDINIKLKGDMAGRFAGSEWMFYTLVNGLTNIIDEDVVIIMGDLWYPVEKAFLEEMKDTRLMKILRPERNRYSYGSDKRAFRCAIRAPINTFSLAPTRESLQYDTATRKALKEAFKEIEDNIDRISQVMIDACPDIWTAIDKALDLQEDLMYQTGRDKVGEPTVRWRGTDYTIAAALGLPAKADTTGAVVTLAVRDLRDGSSRHWNPSPGNLKVRSMRLNIEAKLFPTSGSHTKAHLPGNTITADTSLTKSLGVRQSSGGDSKVKRRPVHALLARHIAAAAGLNRNPNDVKMYVFPSPVNVYTMDPKHNAEFYARRYLTAEGMHAPDKGAIALIVQGTPDQREAYFKAHPWLKVDVKPLPLLKPAVAVKNADGTVKRVSSARSFKSAENLLEFDKPNTKLPSGSWKTIDEVPKDAEYFVHLEKFIPVHRAVKSATSATPVSLSATGQFTWLESGMTLMSLIKGKPIKVYGYRAVGKDAKPPTTLKPLHAELDTVLKDWFDPATLGKYPVHGFHVLMRYGPEGAFNELGVLHDGRSHENFVDLDEPTRKGKRGWYNRTGDGLELLAMLRTVKCRARVSKLPANSTFRNMAETYWKLTGLDKHPEATLEKYHGALKDLHANTTALPENILKLGALTRANMKKYIQPFQVLVRDVWQKYTVLGMLSEIPDEDVAEIDRVMDYVSLVDNK